MANRIPLLDARARLTAAARTVADVTTKGLPAIRAAIHGARLGAGSRALTPSVLEAIRASRYGVITFENHSIIGGLGSAVAETMAEAGLGKRLVRLGLKDQYAHGASRTYLMKEYGLDATALVRAVEQLTGKTLGLAPEDLEAVRLEPAQSTAKPEDL